MCRNLRMHEKKGIILSNKQTLIIALSILIACIGLSSCDKTDDKVTEPVKYCKINFKTDPLARVFSISSFNGEYQYLQKYKKTRGLILDFYHEGAFIKSLSAYATYGDSFIPPDQQLGNFTVQIVDYSKADIDYKRKSGFGIFLTSSEMSTQMHLNEDEFYKGNSMGTEVTEFIEKGGFIPMYYYVFFSTSSLSGGSPNGNATVKELLTTYPDASIIVIKAINSDKPLTMDQIKKSGALDKVKSED